MPFRPHMYTCVFSSCIRSIALQCILPSWSECTSFGPVHSSVPAKWRNHIGIGLGTWTCTLHAHHHTAESWSRGRHEQPCQTLELPGAIRSLSYLVIEQIAHV